MAPKKSATTGKPTDDKKSGEGQGRAVMLSNGERRVDYIRRRFYKDGITRGAIRKELMEKFEHEVPYQIVFAATREKEEPVPKPKAEKKDAKDNKPDKAA